MLRRRVGFPRCGVRCCIAALDLGVWRCAATRYRGARFFSKKTAKGRFLCLHGPPTAIFSTYVNRARVAQCQRKKRKMMNVVFALAFTLLCMTTALFMGASGSLGFALIALFCAFVAFAVSVAAMFISEF